MSKVLAAGALACAAVSAYVTDLFPGAGSTPMLREAQGMPSPDGLPTGHPDASLTSGIYVRQDKHSRYVYRIRDIGHGRALVAYDGVRSARSADEDAATAALSWALATAGDAVWTATQAENNPKRDCRLRFVAHARSIHLLEHDCPVAGKAAPPGEAILTYVAPLTGDEFAEAERRLGQALPL